VDATDDELPDHAWDEAETTFTEQDDLETPELEQPDGEVASVEAEAGVSALIRGAEEGEDG
jgi:hypothetical protein